MIIVDANLLVYAHVTSFLQHVEAHTWLDSHLNSAERVGLPWPSLLAFVRIVTNPRVFETPESVAEAWQQVTSWLGRENCWIPQPTRDHARILGNLLSATGASANLIPDAHLAALAIEHGLQLCSSDRDFARFPQLRWCNPLESA